MISFNSSFDRESKILRRDLVTKKQYIRILVQIENGLIELGTNSYYRDLVYQFPKILQLEVYISREIEQNEKPNTTISLNPNTLVIILDLYKILKKEFPKEDFQQGGQFYHYDQDIENLIQLNPSMFNIHS